VNALERWIDGSLPLDAVTRAQALAEARRAATRSGVPEERWAERLARDDDERERLLAMVVPAESWLFRHAPAFDAIREWIESNRPRRITMMSLGCARGEEAFSLAATAHAAGRTEADCEVIGVDWSAANLRDAERGECPSLAQRGSIPDWAADRFEAGDSGHLRLREAPRRMIRWLHADITRDPLPGPCDVVLCRNVAIYLDEAARSRLARALSTCIRPSGLLCVGHADPPSLRTAEFRALGRAGAFAHARLDAPTSAPGVTRPEPAHDSGPASELATRSVEPSAHIRTLADARALADQGLTGEALELTERLVRHDALDSSAWQLLATLHLACGRESAAEECFRKVVYLRPDDALSLLQLSALAERRNDQDTADRLRLRAARVVSTGQP
jgi:chemotaxis protein methyltransferase WspC